MPRYIDADVLKHELCIRQHMLNADSLWKTLEIMDAQPTADVVERKKGKWIVEGHHPNYLLRCSACQEIAMWAGGISYIYPNFCPKCGADMREEKDNA